MLDALYRIKEAVLDLVRYPTKRLILEHVDYDTYWGDKRGKDLGKLSRWQRMRAEMALRYMGDAQSLTLLDVGCGDGSVLGYIKEHASISRTIGIDVSEKALEKARELGVETIRSQTDPLKTLPVALRVDYVLLFEVLEHMLNPETQLKAMVGIAKKGVFFSFPNTGYVMHRLRLLGGRFPVQWRVHPSEHVRFWTYRDLVWWLKALGYTSYTIHTYEGMPVLNKMWPSLFAKGLFVYLPTQESRP